MPINQARSARGQIVDFDMLRIKSQMESSPKPTVVEARERFVDQKLKRRVKRLNKEATKLAQDASTKESKKKSEPVVEEPAEDAVEE